MEHKMRNGEKCTVHHFLYNNNGYLELWNGKKHKKSLIKAVHPTCVSVQFWSHTSSFFFFYKKTTILSYLFKVFPSAAISFILPHIQTCHTTSHYMWEPVLFGINVKASSCTKFKCAQAKITFKLQQRGRFSLNNLNFSVKLINILINYQSLCTSQDLEYNLKVVFNNFMLL